MQPRAGLPVAVWWGAQGASQKRSQDTGSEGGFIPIRKMDLIPLALKINNILAEQMEPTFLLKAYIFSCLVQ